MEINDVLSALAQKLGLKTTRLQDLQIMKEAVENDIRRNQDKLNDLKEEVSDIDAKLRAKKSEYDSSGPGIRQIIKSEFALLFKQQDQVLETLAGISARLNNGAILLHKTKLLISSLECRTTTQDESVFDGITAELGLAIDEQRDVDKAAGALDNVKYSSMEDVSDERIAAIAADEPIGSAPQEWGASEKESLDELDRRIATINLN